ncbi:MAG: choice-of-anchor Q domain-containing protein [Pseudomonadota bacterium]
MNQWLQYVPLFLKILTKVIKINQARKAHMNRIIVITALSYLLIACGGGGGGGGSASPDYTLVETPVVYSGRNTAATIQGDQLWPFLSIFLGDNSSTNRVGGSISSKSASNAPDGDQIENIQGFKDKLQKYLSGERVSNRGIEDSQCQDNGIVRRSNEVVNNVIVTTLEFDNCLEIVGGSGNNTRFDVLHGRVSISEPAFNTSIYSEFETYNFETFNIQDETGSFSLEGEIDSYLLVDCLQSEDVYKLLVRNDNSGVTYRTESFVVATDCGFSGAEQFNGRIYHPVYGYVDVETPEPLVYQTSLAGSFYESGELILNGSGGTRFQMIVGYSDELDPTKPEVNNNYPFVYKVRLDLDGDGNFDTYFPMNPALFLSSNGANLADSDGDLIPDGYEIQNGFDPNVDDSMLDSDGDGITNLQGFLFQEPQVQLEIEGQFLNNLRVNPTGLPGGVKIDTPNTFTFFFENKSSFIRSLDTLLTLEVSPASSDYHFLDFVVPGCIKITPIYLECELGVIQPGQQIRTDIVVHSPTPVSVALDIKLRPRYMWDGQFNFDNWFQTRVIFNNRESNLFSRVQDFQFSNTDQSSISVLSTLRGNLDDASNPGATLNIPADIIVEKIEVYDANGIYLNDCPVISQPEITCNTSTILTTNNPQVEYHITSRAQSEGTTQITMQSFSDSTQVFGTGFNTWDVITAKSLQPYQDQINSAVNGDIIQVPDGNYVGTLDFLGKDIVVESQNGNQNTSIHMAVPGIVMTNGGAVRGMEFPNARGKITVTGGFATVSENFIPLADVSWIDVRDASITVDSNFISGRGNLLSSCSSQIGSSVSPIIYLLDAVEVNITNNLFINAAITDNCSIINYIQEGAGTVAGVISNNVFYSDDSLVTTAFYLDPSFVGEPIYIQNNVFVSTAVFDLRGFNTSTDPVVRNNLLFGHKEPGYSTYDEVGSNWITGIDPAFANPAGQDFSIGAGSPLIDAGTNLLAPVLDFEGTTRPIDGDGDLSSITDIGVIEYTP